MFGTVLNRFCVQAVIGRPLTVYGDGGQTRGFLNIRDTLQCVELAVEQPRRGAATSASSTSSPSSSRSAELADLVQKAGTELGYEVAVERLENPRVELEEHYYNATHTKLLDLGLEPSHLGEELVESMIHAIERHKDRVIASAIDPHTRWNPAAPPAGVSQARAACSNA